LGSPLQFHGSPDGSGVAATDMNSLSTSSLIHSREARIELARRRYFEEGQSPVGMVSESVFGCMDIRGQMLCSSP
jgi:hypothetical protein